MKTFGKITATLIVLTVSPVIRGYVLSTLWEWFIVPVFEGLPTLKIIESIGIMFVLGYITEKKSKSQEDKDLTMYLIEHFTFVVVSSLIALLLGWTLTFFM